MYHYEALFSHELNGLATICLLSPHPSTFQRNKAGLETVTQYLALQCA